MLINQLQEELKQSQLQKDEVKVSTLRLLLSEVKNAEISKGHQLSDEEIVEVALREAKKRREAAAGFRQGDREEQALKEEAELKILEGYLPVQVSDEELTKVIEQTINELGVSSLADMGKIMQAVMGKVKGQADGGRVSALVRQKLS